MLQIFCQCFARELFEHHLITINCSRVVWGWLIKQGREISLKHTFFMLLWRLAIYSKRQKHVVTWLIILFFLKLVMIVVIGLLNCGVEFLVKLDIEMFFLHLSTLLKDLFEEFDVIYVLSGLNFMWFMCFQAWTDRVGRQYNSIDGLFERWHVWKGKIWLFYQVFCSKQFNC